MQGKEQKSEIKAILIEGPNLLHSSHVVEYEKTPGTLVIRATSLDQVLTEIDKAKDRIQPNVRVDLDCHGTLDNKGNH
jgi:hypothetical protein